MIKLKLLFVVFIILSFTGCNKGDDIELSSIEGTYIGSLKSESLINKSSQVPNNEIIGEIKMKGNQLEFHCFGENIDVIMMLDYFEHSENIMICLTGNDYSNLYGHGHGEGMMSGDGMNHMNSRNTDWTRHLDSSHNQDGHHFISGFNMNNRTLNCTFQWNGNTVTFTGIKN